MKTIIAKTGKHEDELVVVVDVILPNRNKCLTLEGDYHFYTDDGVEIIDNQEPK